MCEVISPEETTSLTIEVCEQPSSNNINQSEKNPRMSCLHENFDVVEYKKKQISKYEEQQRENAALLEQMKAEELEEIRRCEAAIEEWRKKVEKSEGPESKEIMKKIRDLEVYIDNLRNRRKSGFHPVQYRNETKRAKFAEKMKTKANVFSSKIAVYATRSRSVLQVAHPNSEDNIPNSDEHLPGALRKKRYTRRSIYPTESVATANIEKLHQKKNAKITSSMFELVEQGNMDGILRLASISASLLDHSDAEGRTALHVAAIATKEEHLRIVEMTLHRLVIKVNATDKEGRSALHYAASHNNALSEKMIRLLINNGATVNLQSKDGETPLHFASREGHENNARILLSCGASALIKGINGSALAVAAPIESLKLALKQQHCIEEMIVTEEDYIQDLEVVINVFIAPLECSKILNELQINLIFGNIMTLLALHRSFKKSLAHEVEAIAHSFESWGSEFFEAYSRYCSNRTKSYEMLVSLKKNKKFMDFLSEAYQKQECENLTLEDFLMKPIQRICKYPLLLQELLKTSSSSDVERITSALSNMKSVVDVANASKQSLNVDISSPSSSSSTQQKRYRQRIRKFTEDGKMTLKRWKDQAAPIFAKLKALIEEETMIYQPQENQNIQVDSPTNFSHVSHLSMEKNLPTDWIDILKAAGVKKHELRNPETAKYLFEVITAAIHDREEAPVSRTDVMDITPSTSNSSASVEMNDILIDTSSNSSVSYQENHFQDEEKDDSNPRSENIINPIDRMAISSDEEKTKSNDESCKSANLLEEIRRGKKLRKVSVRKSKRKTHPQELVTIISMAIQNRRRELKEDEDCEDSDNSWSDSENVSSSSCSKSTNELEIGSSDDIKSEEETSQAKNIQSIDSVPAVHQGGKDIEETIPVHPQEKQEHLVEETNKDDSSNLSDISDSDLLDEATKRELRHSLTVNPPVEPSEKIEKSKSIDETKTELKPPVPLSAPPSRSSRIKPPPPSSKPPLCVIEVDSNNKQIDEETLPKPVKQLCRLELMKMKALEDFTTQQNDELSFKKGDIIFSEGDDGNEWAYGFLSACATKEGWFPMDKVEILLFID